MRYISFILFVLFLSSCKDKYSRTYYDNGIVASEGVKENGIKVGPWKYFEPDGSLQRIEYNNMGRLDSLSEFKSNKLKKTSIWYYEKDLNIGWKLINYAENNIISGITTAFGDTSDNPWLSKKGLHRMTNFDDITGKLLSDYISIIDWETGDSLYEEVYYENGHYRRISWRKEFSHLDPTWTRPMRETEIKFDSLGRKKSYYFTTLDTNLWEKTEIHVDYKYSNGIDSTFKTVKFKFLPY